ncbi:MAG TPA: hypothetical protein VLI07_10760 [Candidatus Binatus sp.]|nr:hypothetical protein [Candidatus Binatus sp.]
MIHPASGRLPGHAAAVGGLLGGLSLGGILLALGQLLRRIPARSG